MATPSLASSALPNNGSGKWQRLNLGRIAGDLRATSPAPPRRGLWTRDGTPDPEMPSSVAPRLGTGARESHGRPEGESGTHGAGPTLTSIRTGGGAA
jgi:hypothetical protein